VEGALREGGGQPGLRLIETLLWDGARRCARRCIWRGWRGAAALGWAGPAIDRVAGGAARGASLAWARLRLTLDRGRARWQVTAAPYAARCAAVAAGAGGGAAGSATPGCGSRRRGARSMTGAGGAGARAGRGGVPERTRRGLRRHDHHGVLRPGAGDADAAPVMHAYRSHTCADLNAAHVGQTVRLSGWVHRVRDHGGVLFIDLRDHYGITQVLADSDSPAFAALEKVRAEWVIRIDGRVKARDASLVNPKIPPARSRSMSPRLRCWARPRAAAAGLRRAGLPRGNAPDLPLPGPAARGAAPQHDAALERGALDPQPDVGRGLHRVPDADHHRLQPRRGARLPGAVAPASGQVLRPAAGAAAVQAADHGGGLRPLFPDRALFPRRGPARRPLAHRLLPARPGDELRRAGGRVRRRPAGDPGAVRGVRRRQARGADWPRIPMPRA
jgi:hypothetical protein